MSKYFGLADALGLESFISVPEQILETELEGENGQKSVNDIQAMLAIRARANRQRHAVNFKVEVDEADAVAIKWLLDGERRVDALIKLKKCAKEVEVGKHPGMKKSWRLIPNNNLDSMSDD